MRFVKLVEDNVAVELPLKELAVFQQALNEVCNGLHLEEFHSRMGCDRDEALWLLQDCKHAIDLAVASCRSGGDAQQA